MYRTAFMKLWMAIAILLYILVSPSANSRLYYAPSGNALTLGLKNMVKFAEGEQAINPTLKMYSSMGNSMILWAKAREVVFPLGTALTQ
jgi:hypothetical protein